ncbi:MAG: hypothetical protein HY298_23400 [Verrucomicrobia bacterium]|nr:hypothetical protein [Verrucomicrobiota bacterium]
MMNRNAFVYGPVLAFILVCFGAISARGANVCVGPSATGNGSGADWNNLKAWSGSPARGDTWYLVDGNYSGKTFSTPASGSTLITIKKATVGDHGTNTGWVDSMGDGQMVIAGQTTFETSNWMVDGQTGGGPLNYWTNNFGIKINVTGASDGSGFWVNSWGPTNVTLKHFEVVGNGGGDLSYNRGTTFGDNANNCTVSYAYIHDTGECPLWSGGSDSTYEYVYTGRFESTSAQHAEILANYLLPASQNLRDRLTLRYCVFTWCEGTGGLMFEGRTMNVYGCVFVRLGGSTFDYSDGLIGAWINYNTVSDYRIYNCSFINFNDNGSSPGTPTFQTGGSSTGVMEVKNCLFYNASLGFGGFSHDYNTFITPFATGTSFTPEAHGVTNSTLPWVNYPALDFRLIANTAPGTPLGAPYNLDMYGNTRTTWTRGAVEFSSGTNPVISVSPSQLDFGSVTTNTGREMSFTVQNSGAGTLAGTATVSAPYAIISGGTFSLGANQSQTVTVRFDPTTLGSVNRTVTLTGGGGAAVSVIGIGVILPETTPPTITLTAPANGVTVSNTVNLTATASDNVGVVGVRFFVSGTQISDDTASPYAQNWDSTTVTNGSYRIYAQAYDGAGNTAWSGTNVITVSNAPTALPSPAAYWNFDEGTGTMAVDSVSTNTLTLRPGASWAGTGKYGNGLLLDGVNGRADAPNSSGLDISGNTISVAAWVQLENLGTWQQIMCKVKETGAFTSPYFAWHLFSGHVSSTTQWTPQFQLVNASGNSVNVSSSVNVNYGEWVHVVGVFDGSAVRIYVNGVEQGSAAQSGSIISYDQPLYIGAHGLPGEFAKGVIDEARVYSGALSATQVQALYLYAPAPVANRPPPPLGLRFVQN